MALPDSKPNRLVITLTERQRAYVEYRSRMEDKPMAEVVRELIDLAYAADQRRFRQLTKKVVGTWSRGDGLEYQIKIREE